MTDLDEIVESFKLNIDRLEPERLVEILGLLDAVPRTRLNEILEKIAKEAQAYPDLVVGKWWKSAIRDLGSRVREELSAK